MICSPHIKNKISMPHIELVNTIVPISTVARNIGVFFDDALSMKSHVQHVCRVAYYHLHSTGRIQNLLNRKTTEMMVHVYVIFRLDNGNGLLYRISYHLLTKLQRVQNAAAFFIIRTKRRNHITPVLIDLHWLPTKQHIEYKLLMLMFRSLHGLGASYLTNLLTRHHPTRTLRSADAHLLEVPRNKLCTQGNRAFSHAAPHLWNNLPLAMHAADCHNSFKKQLKTLLFKHAFFYLNNICLKLWTHATFISMTRTF